MTHHHHHHGHDHDHGHDHEKTLSFKEKLETLFNHWIDHNNSHKDSYLSWAHKASHEDLADIEKTLGEAAALSEQITEKLEQALKQLKS